MRKKLTAADRGTLQRQLAEPLRVHVGPEDRGRLRAQLADRRLALEDQELIETALGLRRAPKPPPPDTRPQWLIDVERQMQSIGASEERMQRLQASLPHQQAGASSSGDAEMIHREGAVVALTDSERRHLCAVVSGTSGAAVSRFERGRLKAELLQAPPGSEDRQLIDDALRVSAAKPEGGVA